MDIDEFYVKTQNQFGRMQKIWFLSLALFNFYAPFHMIQVVFTGATPKFQCTIGNETYNNTCGPGHGVCDEVVYDPNFDSFIAEWSPSPCLAHVSQIVQMAYMLGVMVGALVLGPVADRYGRKAVLIYSLMGMICFGAVGSFVTSYIAFIVLRFLTGICGAGNMISSFVLSSELIGPSVRGTCGNIFQSLFAFGIVAFCGLAFLIPDNWRTLSLVSALLGIFLIFIATWIPESPRWLYANGHTYKGRKVLERLTRTTTADVEILAPRRHQTGNVQLTMCSMFRVKHFMILTLIFSWFTNSMVYYALTLSSQTLGSNMYISCALSGFVELPAYVLTSIMIGRLGRRFPLVLFMVVAGISCIVLQFTKNMGNATLCLGLLGKLTIAGSFSIIYIHTSELFPTVVRNSGVGLCSSFARVGGVCASVFVSANGHTLWQMIGLGVLSIISGLLNVTLPETNHRKLPETLEDLNRNEVGRYTRLLGDDEHGNGNTTGEEDEEVEEYVRK